MAQKTSVPYDTMSRLSVSSQSIFTKCCCCIPLRLGCFILGYMNLTISVLQTVGIAALTTFVGITTDGFDHYNKDSLFMGKIGNTDDGEPVMMDPSKLGFLLVLMLIITTMWMIIHIACLVGLHKKRPGPIRVYVGFATARLVLAMIGFIYPMAAHLSAKSIVHILDIGLTAYFILVYYIYAVSLEKERDAGLIQHVAAVDASIYPTLSDKEREATLNQQIPTDFYNYPTKEKSYLVA